MNRSTHDPRETHLCNEDCPPVGVAGAVPTGHAMPDPTLPILHVATHRAQANAHAAPGMVDVDSLPEVPESAVLAVIEVMGWPDDRGVPWEPNIPAQAHWELATQLAGAVLDETFSQRWIDQQMAATGIRSADFRNGVKMDLDVARDLTAHFVAAARAMLGDATNYTETKLEFDVKVAESPELYTMVVQRHGPGVLTPHEGRQKAETERDTARADIARLTAELALARDKAIDVAAWQGDLATARAEADSLRSELAELGYEEDDPAPRPCTIVDAGGQRVVHDIVQPRWRAIESARQFWQQEVDDATPALAAVERGDVTVTWRRGDEILDEPEDDRG